MTLSPEQRALRLGRIGSSDIAGICGLSPYVTPFAAWLRVTGREEHEDTDATEMGHALEEPLLRLAAKRENWAILRSGDTVLADDGWRSCTPDFYVSPDDVIGAIAECKNVGHRMMRDWGADLPDYVEAQVQWQLDVTGLTHAYVVAAIGGTGPHVFPVLADRDLQRGLYDTAHAFHAAYVATDTPPPMDGSEAARQYFASKWKDVRPELKPATEAIEALAAQLRHDLPLHAALTEQIEAQKNALRAFIADAAGVQLEDGKVTWKRAKGSQRTDWEAMASHLMTMQKLSLDARTHLLESYTTTSEGSRRLVLPRGWGKADDV